MFEIRWADAARDDLLDLGAFDQRRIIDETEEQLAREPDIPSRRRKLIEGIAPPWDGEPPFWQLSVGHFRIFYEVHRDEHAVYVAAIRRKPPHKTTNEIL